MLRYYKPAALDFLRDLEMPMREIVRDGSYTNGKYASELATKIAERTHYAHAISFGSGTQAIFLLARWFWKLGFRRILAPAFTWPSTYKPFEWTGYHVRFCDINRET